MPAPPPCCLCGDERPAARAHCRRASRGDPRVRVAGLHRPHVRLAGGGRRARPLHRRADRAGGPAVRHLRRSPTAGASATSAPTTARTGARGLAHVARGPRGARRSCCPRCWRARGRAWSGYAALPSAADAVLGLTRSPRPFQAADGARGAERERAAEHEQQPGEDPGGARPMPRPRHGREQHRDDRSRWRRRRRATRAAPRRCSARHVVADAGADDGGRRRAPADDRRESPRAQGVGDELAGQPEAANAAARARHERRARRRAHANGTAATRGQRAERRRRARPRAPARMRAPARPTRAARPRR